MADQIIFKSGPDEDLFKKIKTYRGVHSRDNRFAITVLFLSLNSVINENYCPALIGKVAAATRIAGTRGMGLFRTVDISLNGHEY